MVDKREIKFRALIDGAVVHWNSEFFSDMSPVTCYGSDFPYSDSKDIILMQFTGLQDSNGVDIYEEDVVYVSGKGNVVASFPFIELYEANQKGNIGTIIRRRKIKPE